MNNPEKIEANVDVEQQIVGALLAFGQPAWVKLAGGVIETDFYRDDHRRIFRHIERHARDGGEYDVFVISDALEASNESQLVGELPYLLQLVNAAASFANIAGQAKIIKRHATRRMLQALGNDLAGGGDPTAIAEKLAALAGGAEGDDPFSGPALTLAGAEAETVPAPDFVVAPLQRGDIGIISGADGSGKSFVALALAASVAHGVSVGGIFDVPPARRRALYIAGEDRNADHQRRMQALARRMRQDGVRDLNGVLDVRPLHGQRMPLLEKTRDGYARTAAAARFARQVAGYDLVIIDPLRMFHDIEESDGVGMDKLVRMLVEIAMKNQQVIVVIHHASQGAILDGRDDHHAGRGATDFPAGCRGAWVLRGITEKEAAAAGIDEDSRRDWRVLVNGKASHGKESGKTWLQRREGGLLTRSSYSPSDLAAVKGVRAGVNRQREVANENDF